MAILRNPEWEIKGNQNLIGNQTEANHQVTTAKQDIVAKVASIVTEDIIEIEEAIAKASLSKKKETSNLTAT
ncbi:MAG: hypothetical protein ACTHYC_14915, partial [Sphingobacterium sp.]